MKLLPERTVERLSQYRRVLQRELDHGKKNIYSHELAQLLHITPVQVRRDIMLMQHSSTLRRGYNIENLIKLIGEIIDCKSTQKVAIIGIGNLGKALLNYLLTNNTKLSLSAVFDNNEEKIGKTFDGVICYNIKNLKKIITRENISIAILTVPPSIANDIANKLKEAGISGILNFTPISINVCGIYIEQYDLITSLEKVAYFSKPNNAVILHGDNC